MSTLWPLIAPSLGVLGIAGALFLLAWRGQRRRQARHQDWRERDPIVTMSVQASYKAMLAHVAALPGGRAFLAEYRRRLLREAASRQPVRPQVS